MDKIRYVKARVRGPARDLLDSSVFDTQWGNGQYKEFRESMLQTFGAAKQTSQMALVPRMVDILMENARSLSAIAARNLACRQIADNKDTLLNATPPPNHPNWLETDNKMLSINYYNCRAHLVPKYAKA